MRPARPKAGLCGFDEAMGLTLEELAERLNPARYADLPKTKKKPKATNGEMALFKAALVKLVESQTRAVNVRRVFYLAVSRQDRQQDGAAKPSACRRPCCGCAGTAASPTTRLSTRRAT